MMKLAIIMILLTDTQLLKVFTENSQKDGTFKMNNSWWEMPLHRFKVKGIKSNFNKEPLALRNHWDKLVTQSRNLKELELILIQSLRSKKTSHAHLVIKWMKWLLT
jgi:hypothetical protein